MGMFDYIECRHPLPNRDHELVGWQTKDTPAQFLDTYVITEDGRLLHRGYDFEDQSEHTREGHQENCRKMSCLRGMATRVNERDEEVSDFTGSITFYGGEHPPEYGRLIQIVQVTKSATDTTGGEG